MDESPRQARLSSRFRGVVIAVMIVAYGWFVGYPQGSFALMFAVGVAMQLLVIFIRQFVPASAQPQAQYVFELVADAVTVLTFALGVFGGIARLSAEV